MEKYFNQQQLAKYMKVTEATVIYLLQQGKVPAIKTPSNVYIFKKSDIDEWLQAKKKKVQSLLATEEDAQS